MVKQSLDRFKGRLTAAQIAVGMNAACANAKRLVGAAQLLLDNGHYPIAASLAAIAIEESGKLPILRRLATVANDNEAISLWRDFRSHTQKNVMWLMPQLFANGARKLDDFKELFAEDAEHPSLLDNVKQIGLYTDCLGKAHWSDPSNVVDKPLAQMLLQTAKILARDGDHSELEIQLWIKHMGSVKNRSKERLELALAEWYRDMHQNGLVKDIPDGMENFIIKGVERKKNG